MYSDDTVFKWPSEWGAPDLLGVLVNPYHRKWLATNIGDNLQDWYQVKNDVIPVKELFDRMAATMIKRKGFGLSCNQVGLQYSMFVFGNPTEPESIVGAFNPKIVDFSSGLEYGEEGCLSYPGLFIKIKRPTEIRARITDWQKNIDTFKLTGLTARVFQHEYDHLQGINFTQRANKIHLDRAKKQKVKLDRLRRKNAKRTPL